MKRIRRRDRDVTDGQASSGTPAHEDCGTEQQASSVDAGPADAIADKVSDEVDVDVDVAEDTRKEDSGGGGDHGNGDLTSRRRLRIPHGPISRVVAFAVLPGVALAMAVGAGFFKWQTASATEIRTVAAQSTAAASEHAIALLSYKADTVDKQLTAATSFLTGGFRDDYVKLIHDVVIPGAKQKGISAQATVPAAASVSTEPSRSVVLLFIDQTVTVGSGPPTTTSSSVQVTLQKEGDQWLIAQFDPV